MNTTNTLPIELVHHILTYDRKYMLKDGKIVCFNKLCKEKYGKIMELLLTKPKIYSNYKSPYNFNDNILWAWAYLSENIRVSYSYNTTGSSEVILFRFKKTGKSSCEEVVAI